MTTKTKAELGIEVKASTGRASKNIQAFGKEGAKSLKSMEKASKQFSVAFKAAIALFASKPIGNFIGTVEPPHPPGVFSDSSNV